jgi:HlyD family secretion protein
MTTRRITTFAAMVFAATVLAYLLSRPVPAQLAPGSGFGDVPRVRNPLNNKVVEVGSIESADSVKLRSNLKEPTSIQFVIAEGTHVKSGDVVVRLDSAALDSEHSKHKITLANVESELLNAEAELDAARELQEVLGRADEARVKAAIRRHASYLAEGGEFALKADRLNVELNLAKTRAEFATKKLKRLERSAEDVNDLEAARLELSEARAEITSLEAGLRLLEQHEKPAEAAEREVAVLTAQAKKIQNRTELNKRVQVARSQLAAAKISLQLAGHERELLEKQIEACIIKSPQAGVVVHANQFSSRGAAAVQPRFRSKRARSFVHVKPSSTCPTCLACSFESRSTNPRSPKSGPDNRQPSEWTPSPTPN